MKKKKIQNFSDHSEIFFCFPIHKKLNKSCSLDKNFLFLKKKVVSLKKTKICRIFKTNREIFLPVHSPNLYGISIWKMHGRSHGNFFICFGDFQQQWGNWQVLLVCHKNKWRDLSQKLVTSLFLFIERGQENIFIGPKNIFDQ